MKEGRAIYSEITSNSNPKIKHVKELHKKKYRDKYNEFIIEGIRIIEHGLYYGRVNSIFLTREMYEDIKNRELFKMINSKEIDIYIVPQQLFKEISDTNTPQGILGIANKVFYEIDDILNDKSNYFFIVLDRLQDPGNVGTIIRTADAAGVDCIITNKGCVDVYNTKTIRATMGSIFTMPVIHIDDSSLLIKQFKDHGIKIVSTILETNKYHFEVEYGNKVAIIIGNEGNGISEELIKESDLKIKIPIIGSAESLNASVASSIVIYEVLRQNINSEN